MRNDRVLPLSVEYKTNVAVQVFQLHQGVLLLPWHGYEYGQTVGNTRRGLVEVVDTHLGAASRSLTIVP